MKARSPHVLMASAGMFGVMLACRATFAQTPDAPPANAPAAARPLPPQVVLGRRVEALRRAIPVAPMVVIVTSGPDYAAAIARWTPQARFPILIDDGTARCREDIARFVRAFEPLAVVRWAPPEDDRPAWPADRAGRARVVEAAAWKAWGCTSVEESLGAWARAGFVPFGVVVASGDDPAWTAALALAAGRAQPFVWLPHSPGRVRDPLADNDFAAFDQRIQQTLESLSIPGGWKRTGDSIEAVTLCLNIGGRLGSANGPLALTDRLGRNSDLSRFAWSGLIFGNEAQAAYRAMCPLFLQSRSAWLFDGYRSGFAPPFALKEGADVLTQLGFTVAADLPPAGGLEHWRQRCRFGVSADFIEVNTSGHPEWFDLSPGRAAWNDVPPLHRPALVYFVHSFSAQRPDDEETIAGAFLARGAYAYYGSIDEPMLGAFTPGPAAAGRTLAGAPFAPSVRHEDKKAWKLQMLGDPLITIGDAARRLDAPIDPPGARPLDESMRRSLQARDLEAAAIDLILLGRDEDAARLAAAALDEDESTVTGPMARACLGAVFRRGDAALFVRVFARLDEGDRRDWEVRDMLWSVARPILFATSDERLVAWLRLSIRPANAADDVQALAPAVRRVFGDGAVRSMAASIIDQVHDDGQKKIIRQMMGGR